MKEYFVAMYLRLSKDDNTNKTSIDAADSIKIESNSISSRREMICA